MFRLDARSIIDVSVNKRTIWTPKRIFGVFNVLSEDFLFPMLFNVSEVWDAVGLFKVIRHCSFDILPFFSISRLGRNRLGICALCRMVFL